MFDNTQVEKSQCKPDPEKQLQRAKARIEDAKKELNAVKEMIKIVKFPSRKNEEPLLSIIGELMVKKWQAEDDEKKWLEEINK